MTSLRQRMTEDMQVRNLALNTQTSYVQQVSLFARHFDKSPEQLGPEDIRAYQVYLTNEKKLAPGSILIAVAALRFLYKVSLKKDWTFEDVIPAPKKPQKLPVVLSPEEVLHFLELRRQHQASRDSDHLLRRRPAHLRGRPPEAHRYRQSAHGHSRRTGQGAERSLRDAVAQAAGNPAQLVASGAAQAVAVSEAIFPASHINRDAVELACQKARRRLRHPQADHAAFAAPRLRGSSAGIRHRCPHHSTAARPSQPGDHRPLPADRHQQSVLDLQSARPAAASDSR